MVVGSLSLNAVVAAQSRTSGSPSTCPSRSCCSPSPPSAELNRGPFDLPESESELVSGYGTEYSGMRFGMFFLNEYAGMTIMSMVAVTLFFGGWQGPFANALASGASPGSPSSGSCVKIYVLVFVLVWVRLSLPRLQVDQLMGFAWKILIPLGLVNHPGHRGHHPVGRRSWKLGMAVFSWIAFFAFVGLLDPILKLAPAQAARAPARW